MNQYNEIGEKHGPWEEYWFNGTLWFKGTYSNGKRHGLYKSYYLHNGKLDYIVNYVNGKKHRLMERYTINNKLYLKQYYL